jgi:hypothetical protein
LLFRILERVYMELILRVGQDTQEVLTKLLKITLKGIEQLVRCGAVEIAEHS